VVVWLCFSLALFFAGVAFAYFVAIPAALTFLVNFGKGVAVPDITLGRYVSFFGALEVAGGIVFQISIAVGLLADAGIVNTQVLRRKRPHAIIAIMIFAAVITPTQDIVNMLIFALPMMLLFEIGLLIAGHIEKKRQTPDIGPNT
jgi:sec-independent protein translocase protein TatC